GSQYGGVLSGGARECHFCTVSPGWGTLFPTNSVWRRAGVLAGHGSCFLRAATRAAIEPLLAQHTPRANDNAERQAHKTTAPLERELAVVGAAIDAARGL